MTDKKEGIKKKVHEFLDPQGDNFMGTGLNFYEFTMKGLMERFRRSWFQHDRRERKRRLQLIYELAAERQRVLAQTAQATASFDMALEAIIEGDRREVQGALEFVSFEGEEGDWADEKKALYAPTRAILQRALDLWPHEKALFDRDFSDDGPEKGPVH
jgi:hypothetical protein